MSFVCPSVPQDRESSVSIDADSAAELFAEVAMLSVAPSHDPIAAAQAWARLSSTPVIRWAEELQGKGYHAMSFSTRGGHWHAELRFST